MDRENFENLIDICPPASRGVAHETSARGVQAMAARDPASGEVAKGSGVPHAGDSAMAKHRGIFDPAFR